jgi:hypothetical protein
MFVTLPPPEDRPLQPPDLGKRALGLQACGYFRRVAAPYLARLIPSSRNGNTPLYDKHRWSATSSPDARDPQKDAPPKDRNGQRVRGIGEHLRHGQTHPRW